MNLSNSALVVVDMQNGCCGRGGVAERTGLGMAGLDDVVVQVDKLARAFRERGRPVVFTRLVFRPGYLDGGVLIDVLRPELREHGGLVAGTWDAEIVAELTPQPGDQVVEKHRFSAFFNTNLDGLLKNLRIDTVVVTGVSTSICVDSTVRDALARDYLPILVRDAVGDHDPERHMHALRVAEYTLALVRTADDVVAALKR